MKFISFIFFIATTSQAAIPEGVFTELGQFATQDGQTLPEEYLQKFPLMIEQAVEDRQKAIHTSVETSCSPSVSVKQSYALTKEKNAAVREFESGLIRIEAIACLPKTNSSTVLKILTDPVFRKKAISTIQKTYSKNEYFCEITQAPTIGRSNYCFAVQASLSENFSKATSYNVWNSSVLQTYSVPVYYRGVFETSIQTPTQTVYHMITYIRANKFNMIQKIFAEKYIISVEDAILKQLELELK